MGKKYYSALRVGEKSIVLWLDLVKYDWGFESLFIGALDLNLPAMVEKYSLRICYYLLEQCFDLITHWTNGVFFINFNVF